MPPGYTVVWSGQYEYMLRAEKRLKLVIPVTLCIIFVLLFLNFRNLTESAIVMLSLPFAMVGGIWLMYFLDYDMSVAVGVGFIALGGLAAETGVIMLLYLDHATSVVSWCVDTRTRAAAHHAEDRNGYRGLDLGTVQDFSLSRLLQRRGGHTFWDEDH